MEKILIIDSNAEDITRLSGHLESTCDLRIVTRGSDALETAVSYAPDIILLDNILEDRDGMVLLSELRAKFPDTFILLISSSKEIDLAVKAMKMGAFDYLSKPVDLELIDPILDKMRSFRSLKSEVGGLKQKLRRNKVFSSIVGESKEIERSIKQAERALDREVNVLILGESGTGKELLARAIHAGSGRGSGPFVVINCAAITADLADSLMFGHRRGSFTGAIDDHPGYFEQADKGTIFLDEIGDMNLEVQAKVLRVLEDKIIRRLGEKRDIKVDFRIISATNRDFSQMISQKLFRSDLYYRLEEYPLRLPSLKDRPSDIPVLARHFLNEFCDFYEIDYMSISDEVMEELKRYAWPGNVRELKNVMRRAAVQSADSVIREIQLFASKEKEPDLPAEQSPAAESEFPFKDEMNKPRLMTIDELEKKAITYAYYYADKNPDKTAVILDISRATLYRKLKKYGLLK